MTWRDLTEDVFAKAMTAFGDEVEFRPQVGDAFTRTVIVDNLALPVEVDGEVEVSASAPVLSIQLSAFPQPPKQNDEGTVMTGLFAGKQFRIVDVLKDGQGGAKLPLHWI